MKLSKEKASKIFLYLFVTVMVAILATMGGLIAILFTTLEDSVYNERCGHLEDVVDKSSDILEAMIDSSFTYSHILKHVLQDHAADYSDLKDLLEYATETINVGYSVCIAVDSNGNYYTSDNNYGKVQHLNYYTPSSDEQLLYIGKLPHESNGVENMFFRIRLTTPIVIDYLGKTTTIQYCVISRTMDYVLSTMNQDIGTSSSNTFICKLDGTILYKKLDFGFLIPGLNFINKYSSKELTILHGIKAEDIVEDVKNKKNTVIEVQINKNEFYIATSAIGNTGYFYGLIVDTVGFSSGLESYQTNIFLYIAGIVLLFAFSVIFIVLFGVKISSNKKLLLKEKQANQYLAQAAEAAQSASNAKTDFLSNMSHDIRTPINGICGMTEIAMKVPNNPEKTIDCLNKIDGASKHLLSLVNDVLDMAKIESGDTVMAHNPMNLKTCIDNCISIIKGQTEHIDLNVYAVTDQLQDQHVFGDELHLRQVFINILGNAVKFTPEGGSITLTAIETKKEGNVGTYTFAIKDTGKGMSEKFIPHIFDAFSQEEEGSRTKYKGTGLGMAITKKFVDKMGGNITVTSKEGYGTTFTIEVPFDINVDYVEEEKDEETSDINVEGLKVLLVEDNMLNMEIAKTLLEDVGVIVTSAYNGQEAVDIFENSKKGDFDAIFMDVMMPVLNGLDATEKIRQSSKSFAKTIPIIAMTANAYDEDIKKTMNAGMNAHISKPIEMNIVLKTLYEFTRKNK